VEIKIPPKVFNVLGGVNWKKSYAVLLDSYIEAVRLLRISGNGAFIEYAKRERANFQEHVWKSAEKEKEYEVRLGKLEAEKMVLQQMYDRDTAALKAQIEQFLTPSSASDKAMRDPVTNKFVGYGGLEKDEKEALAWELWQGAGGQKTPEVYNYIGHQVRLAPESARQYIAEYDKKLKKYLHPSYYNDLVEVVRRGATGICTADPHKINFGQVNSLLDEPGDIEETG